jgi:hypothetical protein
MYGQIQGLSVRSRVITKLLGMSSIVQTGNFSVAEASEASGLRADRGVDRTEIEIEARAQQIDLARNRMLTSMPKSASSTAGSRRGRRRRCRRPASDGIPTWRQSWGTRDVDLVRDQR